MQRGVYPVEKTVLKKRSHVRKCRITRNPNRLIHLPDQLVDLVFAVAQISSFNEVLELSLMETTIRAVELERPQEI